MFLLIFLSVSGENIDSSFTSTTNANLLISYISFMILYISMECDYVAEIDYLVIQALC